MKLAVLASLLSLSAFSTAQSVQPNWVNNHIPQIDPADTQNEIAFSDLSTTTSSLDYSKPFQSMVITGSTPTVRVTVGGTPLNFTVDPESAMTIVASGVNTSAYNFVSSSSSVMYDPFKFRDGSYNSLGYYVNDAICYQYSSNGQSPFSSGCMNQAFLAAQFNVAQYGPAQGAIGLGMGTPRYGQNFFQLVNSQNGMSANSQWSYVGSAYLFNQTSLMIGGPQMNKLQGSTINYYNVIANQNQWTINCSTIGWSTKAGFAANISSTPSA
jgi:hypothetical protein